MANKNKLGSCKTCGGQVSKSAKTCPHCGEVRPYVAPPKSKPAPSEKPSKSSIFVGLIIIIFIGMVLLGNEEIEDAQDPVTASEVDDDTANNSAAETPSSPPTKWQMSEEISPIDDSKNVFLSLDANGIQLNRYGQSVNYTLFLRCKENKTDAIISFNRYLGIDDTRILYRIDDESAKTRNWNISTNNESVFAKSPITFIKTLQGKDKLFVEVTPYGQNSTDAVFDLAGLDELLPYLREACVW